MTVITLQGATEMGNQDKFKQTELVLFNHGKSPETQFFLLYDRFDALNHGFLTKSHHCLKPVLLVDKYPVCVLTRLSAIASAS